MDNGQNVEVNRLFSFFIISISLRIILISLVCIFLF